MSDRVTVSLTDESREALENLTERTGRGQSEVLRQALSFYAANFDAASASAGDGADLGRYYRMLSGGEHVLLDVDFLHAFLDYVEGPDGDPDPAFLAMADRVADYHAREYEGQFADVGDLLDWLAFCGFLTVRHEGDGLHHVVFPSESIRWFMTRFLRRTTADLSFDIEVEEGVSKTLVRQVD
ncbi:MAG: ribbon-helix-helix protein, CopG family [Haloferacaceae archaeon]